MAQEHDSEDQNSGTYEIDIKSIRRMRDAAMTKNQELEKPSFVTETEKQDAWADLISAIKEVESWEVNEDFLEPSQRRPDPRSALISPRQLETLSAMILDQQKRVEQAQAFADEVKKRAEADIKKIEWRYGAAMMQAAQGESHIQKRLSLLFPSVTVKIQKGRERLVIDDEKELAEEIMEIDNACQNESFGATCLHYEFTIDGVGRLFRDHVMALCTDGNISYSLNRKVLKTPITAWLNGDKSRSLQEARVVTGEDKLTIGEVVPND
jgi:hypothetical protein